MTWFRYYLPVGCEDRPRKGGGLIEARDEGHAIELLRALHDLDDDTDGTLLIRLADQDPRETPLPRPRTAAGGPLRLL